MLKDALKTFAGKHNNYRARQLKKILEEEPPFSLQSGDKDISFNAVVTFFQENGFEPAGFSEGLILTHKENDLWRLFVTGSLPDEEKQEEARPSLLQGPALYPVMDTVIAQFLDAKSIACLSVCSSSLYAQTKGLLWWKEKLIALGCHRESLDKVIHGKAVENYKRLYGVMLKISYKRRINSAAWELCCLSGEPLSIKWAEQHEALNSNTRGYNGANALHNAAWSGSVEAIRYCIGTLRIPADSTAHTGANALHYAARSGSVEAIRYCIETLRIPAASTENNGANALHNAAWSGSVEAVYFVRRLAHTLNLPLHAIVQDQNGHDAFWYADKSKNSDAIKTALNIPIEQLMQIQEKSEIKNDQKKIEVPDSHGIDPSERRQIGSRKCSIM